MRILAKQVFRTNPHKRIDWVKIPAKKGPSIKRSPLPPEIPKRSTILITAEDVMESAIYIDKKKAFVRKGILFATGISIFAAILSYPINPIASILSFLILSFVASPFAIFTIYRHEFPLHLKPKIIRILNELDMPKEVNKTIIKLITNYHDVQSRMEKKDWQSQSASLKEELLFQTSDLLELHVAFIMELIQTKEINTILESDLEELEDLKNEIATTVTIEDIKERTQDLWTRMKYSRMG